MKQRESKGKRSNVEQIKSIPWKERKRIADRDEEALKQDIEDLNTWTNMIDGMNDEQLKAYIENRPEELRTLKVQKTSIVPRPKFQRNVKPKSSASNCGIMASVWKFHKEDEDEDEDEKINVGL